MKGDNGRELIDGKWTTVMTKSMYFKNYSGLYSHIYKRKGLHMGMKYQQNIADQCYFLIPLIPMTFVALQQRYGGSYILTKMKY